MDNDSTSSALNLIFCLVIGSVGIYFFFVNPWNQEMDEVKQDFVKRRNSSAPVGPFDEAMAEMLGVE